MNKRYIPMAMALAFLLTGPVAMADAQEGPVAKLEQKSIRGKIIESMSGAGYTYLLLEAGEESIWVAIPEIKIATGQVISVQPGMVMTNFESKALSKIFERLIFSPGLEESIPNLTEQMEIPDDVDLEAISGGSSKAIMPASEIQVEKAQGENARTVEECFTAAEQLDQQKVRIQGKVVKFSPMIMGKNWIHLQDGTGNPTKNTHNLVVTSLEEPVLNSVVVLEGVLHKDKDFGAGYRYSVIIEDAQLVQ
jgi:hypothetical protein